MILKKIHWVFIYVWVALTVIPNNSVAHEFLNDFAVDQSSYRWDCNHKDKNPFNNSNFPINKEENKNEERIDENLENEFTKNSFSLFEFSNHYSLIQKFSTHLLIDELKLHLFSILRFENLYFLHRFLSYCILRD